MPDVCLFCQNAAGVTVEHTLSDPIRKLVPGVADLTVEHLRVKEGVLEERRPYETDSVSYQRKGYCSGCNNTWMQAMDNEVAPLLLPLVEGDVVSISPTDQYALATWVTKIALVYESLSGSERVVPNEAYRWFYDNRRPFEGMPIQLGDWLGSTWRHTYVRRVITRKSYPGGVPRGTEGVVITFILEHFVSQTLLHGAWPTGWPVAVEGADRVTIWPPVLNSLQWPPRLKVDPDTLLAFSDLVGENHSAAQLRARLAAGLTTDDNDVIPPSGGG